MVVTPKKKTITKKQKKEKENHLLNKGPNTPTEAPRRRADSSHSNTAIVATNVAETVRTNFAGSF